MGIAKRMLEEDEDRRHLAIGILVEVGALNECENHPGEFYDGGGEVTEAYKIANFRMSKGEIEIPHEGRKIITDAIQSAYEDNGASEVCTICRNNFERD